MKSSVGANLFTIGKRGVVVQPEFLLLLYEVEKLSFLPFEVVKLSLLSFEVEKLSLWQF